MAIAVKTCFDYAFIWPVFTSYNCGLSMCGNTEALLMADLPSERPKLESKVFPSISDADKMSVVVPDTTWVCVHRIVSVQNVTPDRDHYGSSLMAVGPLWYYC